MGVKDFKIKKISGIADGDNEIVYDSPHSWYLSAEAAQSLDDDLMMTQSQAGRYHTPCSYSVY